jgi:hypothetical protein
MIVVPLCPINLMLQIVSLYGNRSTRLAGLHPVSRGKTDDGPQLSALMVHRIQWYRNTTMIRGNGRS